VDEGDRADLIAAEQRQGDLAPVNRTPTRLAAKKPEFRILETRRRYSTQRPAFH
jgi:hypothetical protein